MFAQGSIVQALNKKYAVLPACLVLYCFGFLISACTSSPAADRSAVDNIDSLEKKMLDETGVYAETAGYKTINFTIESNGKIKAFKEHTFYALNSGLVNVCPAKSGIYFPANSMLLKMETTASQLKHERNKLRLFNAQKEYESQLLGYDNLLKEKQASEANDIKKKLRISSGLSDAEQDLKESDYELEQTVMLAPFNGIVANVNVKDGDYIKNGQELFTLYGNSELFAEVKILEEDVFTIKKGTHAQIVLSSSDGQTYQGEVHTINPYIDDNGMVTVRVKIMNAANKLSLFPGMNCQVKIRLPQSKALTVPKSAVIIRSNREVIFTIENNKAKWHYVTLGKDNGKEVEVKEGINDGDRVITSNNLQLGDESPVHEIKN